jgi:hypothetical protein
MPGPLPKDPKIRSRRNKSATRAMLPGTAKPRVRAPRLPKLPEGQTWNPMAKRFWEVIWSSPMSHEFLQADEPALFRLLVLVNQFWKKGELEVAREIRMLEREFGLTPLSRRRLEWTVAQAEEAVDSHAQRRAKRATLVEADVRTVGEDPRGVLDK